MHDQFDPIMGEENIEVTSSIEEANHIIAPTEVTIVPLILS